MNLFKVQAVSIYLPSNSSASENNLDEGQKPADNEPANNKRGRKKIRKPDSWKRNVQKMKRAKGEAYKSTSTGKLVPERKQGDDCKCSKKCIEKLSETEKQEIISAFNTLSNQEKQDSYLSSLIQVLQITRRRKIEGNPGILRNHTYKYKLRKGAFELNVCKMAICLLHGIGKKRLEPIATHLSTNITPVQDKRVRHSSRPNSFPNVFPIILVKKR
ncbi:unnamed protein product [Acanthoscelides obtectus]|uniref:Uncharacterized protein n=1 Tax=Acanthoscelides obtectus TaxID=200917 RepID=A0A9P0JP81_ACAOB|nr:unnamed protein product [Acanthoscelides obtectus]CAK1642977.1 hypothetical protein AOBTE_LOCUS13332 [Acanthoscelides obtectus]